MRKDLSKGFGSLAAMMMSVANGNSAFGAPSPITAGLNPNQKFMDSIRESNEFTRDLKPFTIKGKVVMARSKKDAIKRYNHQSK